MVYRHNDREDIKELFALEGGAITLTEDILVLDKGCCYVPYVFKGREMKRGIALREENYEELLEDRTLTYRLE